MTGSPTTPVPPPKPGQHIIRWRRWLKRIHGEFIDLLIQQDHFLALQAVMNANIRTLERPEIGRWMAQGYLSYACSAIRRLIEPPPRNNPPKDPKKDPKLSISLVILLRDIEHHAHLLTRRRMCQLYVQTNRNARDFFARFADKRFTELIGSSRATALAPTRVERRLRAITRATRMIDRFVNKKVAHHERHRKRVPRRSIRFDEIDRAIKVLLESYKWCSHLVTGNWCDPRVDGPDFDIRPDLRRLWPDAKHPDPPKREYGPEYDGIPD